MTVKVNQYGQNEGRPATEREHDKGEVIEVDAVGHLLVQGKGRKLASGHVARPTVAIYAPGKWLSAEVVVAEPQA